MTKQQKTLKQLIQEFNTNKPDFNSLIPYLTGELEADLNNFKGELVGKFNSIKTLWQLSLPEKPKSRSRVWKSPRGYKFLVQWTNAVLLRILIRKFTSTLPRSEHRTKTQLDDAGRSIVSNIEEGFKRPTTSEYLQFLGYTQGSLEEINGDINKCLQDGFLKSTKNSGLSDLGIDLKAWSEWVKNPTNSTKLLYFPLNSSKYRTLKDVSGSDLTYEMFIELTNKTDWLLRKLVESLEKKLNKDKKGYEVEKARIKDKLKNKLPRTKSPWYSKGKV